MPKLRFIVINGPNLDLLGTREPSIYGHRTFEDFISELKARFPHIDLDLFQSNDEGSLVTALRKAALEQDGVVMNAAGYSHTSVALRDSISAVAVPVVEVHISNIHAREPFRHNTLTGGVCEGVISGFGLEGYALAIQFLLSRSGQ